MTRRIVGSLVTLTLGLLAVSLAADGQPPMKVPRVGVLSPQHATESPTVQREPLAQGLRALGWEPGTSLLIEHRYAEGEVDRLPALAAELVRLPVDVIVARGGAAVRAARQATSTIPIVMSATADPVRQGFVASLAGPGGNITGLAFLAQGALEGKRLELLKEAVPGLSRVAFLVHWPAVPGEAESFRQELHTAARSLRLEVQAFEVSGPETLVEAFTAMERAQVGAFLLGADTRVLEPNLAQVVAVARTYRLPAMYPWRLYVDAGGLMSYAASIPDFHRRSASYVDKLLKGAKPADLPVEQPTQFELVINLKTAQALGLTIPPTLLSQADEVIR
jgi:putative tryptophan/tyrosine transport system substrate-binding protein